MNYFLIDYENVSTDDIKDLSNISAGDSIIIFYSGHCSNISLDLIDYLCAQKVELSCYKVKTGTKNALDFQLASHLGYLIGKGNDDDKYYIVSNDKGYDCLCDYWKKYNKCVGRIQMTATVSSASKKKNRKVSESDIVTLSEIKEYLSNDEFSEEILLIVNQYKTKQAICNGMAKKFKDSKKASVIYKKLKPLLKKKNKT